jgi:anti-sigma28 factor (negative regulator of flagellin synthesis)
MVDSINGPGKRIIITTKPKAKESVEKKSSFDETLKDRAASTDKPAGHSVTTNATQANLKIMQQQQLVHMQRVQEIARQVQDGTYKMVDPAVLADKIYQVISDRTTREKFIKKLIQEEAEKIPAKDRGKMSELEFKKLIFLVKESQDEPFEDPELEALLKEFS